MKTGEDCYPSYELREEGRDMSAQATEEEKRKRSRLTGTK